LKPRRGVAALGLWLMATGTGHAQSAPPHDQVFDLATIRAAHEVCSFALTDEQIEIIDQREQSLADQEGIAPAELASVTAEVTASLRRQSNEGVCKANGAEAQLYQRKLAEYGLL
jgi:hypothetical protein